MRKINKFFAAAAISMLAVCAPVHAAEATGESITQEAVKTQPQVKKKVGLVKEGSRYVYYDKKGKKLKNKWRTINKKRYYFDEKGYAVRGGKKIGDHIYVFDMNGRLIRPSSSKIVTVGKNSYYVDKNGHAYVGFFKLGNRLYRGDVKGRLTKNKTVANVSFNSKGYAKDNMDSKLKMMLMDIISRITTPEMSRSQKLYACWCYLTSKSNFYYSGYWPDLSKSGWQREEAYYMLTTGGGDCYGFACTFAAMAREIGYDPYVVLGRVTGNRDGAADGLTSHGWVIIDGAYYDPEAQFAGWYQGVYGSGSYDINHRINHIVRYAS